MSSQETHLYTISTFGEDMNGTLRRLQGGTVQVRGNYGSTSVKSIWIGVVDVLINEKK